MKVWKWFRWVLLGVVTVGLFIIGFAAWSGHQHDIARQTKEGTPVDGGKDGLARPFTDAQLAAANLALSKGVKIDDPQNDWYDFGSNSFQPDGRQDNPHPYPLGWTDYRSVNMGADVNYLYFKFQVWDKFPLKVVTYNGDTIRATTLKVDNLKFTNKEGKHDSADIDANIWFVRMEGNQWKISEKPWLSVSSMISPTGYDEHMETIYKIYTGAGLVAGGPGFDYILAAYPLSLFNLKQGDTITFDIGMETGSTVYHHESIDMIFSETGSKFGTTISYQIGSNTYKLLPGFDKSVHE